MLEQSFTDRFKMDKLTWLLARARAYLLATVSRSLELHDVAITLDVSRLKLPPSSMAWMSEIPTRYLCSMPIYGYWIAYVNDGCITYYKGDLANAHRYHMHLVRHPVPHLTAGERTFAVLVDAKGQLFSKHTLYFTDISNEHELSAAISFVGHDIWG
jgi:hypothetical protein